MTAGAGQDVAPMRIGFERPSPLAHQSPIMCQECETWWQVDPDDLDCWTCPGCQRLAVYAVQPGVCKRCERPARMLREGHRLRSLCLCHLTDEQRRQAARLRRMQDEQERQEENRALQARVIREEAAEQGKLSASCWERRGRKCSESRADPPFNYCRTCPRWVQ